MLADGVIAAARTGDARAIEAVITECYSPVRRFLLYLTDEPDMVDDLTQDVMLSAARHLSTLSNDVSLMPWLYQMARNALHSHGRRRRLRPMDSLEQWMARAASNRDIVEPVSAIEQAEDDVCVQQLLDSVSPADRELMYLRHVAGFTATEIGMILGISHVTARQRIHRVVATIRQQYVVMPSSIDVSYVQREVVDGAG